ncbi:hypothetical protein HPP92_011820 [Vanilla planifolia]|uniref:Uncharacterized protein n=1 Tax=Vanilla planifolia TaxID=51239 RepID=A0A835R6H0_VANPL|nr:hypothetical protein HPP92_011820 [Vanilla planifolia]
MAKRRFQAKMQTLLVVCLFLLCLFSNFSVSLLWYPLQIQRRFARQGIRGPLAAFSLEGMPGISGSCTQRRCWSRFRTLATTCWSRGATLRAVVEEVRPYVPLLVRLAGRLALRDPAMVKAVLAVIQAGN